MKRGDENMTDGSFADVREQYAEYFGRAAALYNINPLLGRLYGYLYLAPEPLSLDDLSTMVGSAKSTVSVAMRSLEHYRAVQRLWLKGERRDYFVVRTNMNQVLQELFNLFFSHELKYMQQANISATRALESEADGEDWPDHEQRQDLLERLRTLDVFLETTSLWLKQIINPEPEPVKPSQAIQIEVEE
jgi:DNA-binding transcriptional regulator GbsR (MarR family)